MKLWGNIIFILLLYSPTVGGTDLDITKVGVKIDEEFTVITKMITESSKFEYSKTYKIIDVKVDNENSIKVEKEGVEERFYLDEFGSSLIIFTDWDYWSKNLTSNSDELSYKVNNGKNLFTVKLSIDFGNGTLIEYDKSYKKNGIINRFYTKFSTIEIIQENSKLISEDESILPGFYSLSALFGLFICALIARMIRNKRIYSTFNYSA